MKTKIKNVLEFIAVAFAILMVIAFFIVVEHGKSQEVMRKDAQIRYLKNRINELELTDQHIISINGDNLKVLSKLNIAGKVHEHTHKELIILGENKFYYVLSDEPNRMSIDMNIVKY